ncbi:MAG: 30S ribosomal protein S4 [Candidatus Doudnabacteria bacterium]|nr:30S ribosomal protein S4 [Candidatus Doudnabacteria bacterium]
MRYTGPKAKKARRLGQAFTAKQAKIMQRRPQAPGQHGASRSRLSEFGLQLREKQKAKLAYGLMEKQFSSLYKKALRKVGVTGDNLIKLLETRLDNAVYRLGFAETRAQARQLVSHGFFEVNGKKVDIPSFHLKVGDILAVKSNKQKSAYMEKQREKLKNHKSQEWLQLDAQKMSGRILTEPTPEMVDNVINMQLIVEHYSR